MNHKSPHTFHIPVMGLAYTVDTPAKVAHFGISSVVSIMEDNLLEELRNFYSKKYSLNHFPIKNSQEDYRARRITAYLNMLNTIVEFQVSTLKSEAFTDGNDIMKYFELLPPDSELSLLFFRMLELKDGEERLLLQNKLRESITSGSIDVNIMTKCDRINYSRNKEALPQEYSDAMAALRGYANSELKSALVFSAGMNPHLYAYCESFPDFFPDANGNIKKRIILKVSDFRSAYIQGKYLAKKGIFVSEFRIESGLNCGGHAFATEGLLLGPILEEFKSKRETLAKELFELCNIALLNKAKCTYKQNPGIRISVQGGIGTAAENAFLLKYYCIDSSGWGSPFLLVPEATNVDKETLDKLIKAEAQDYFLSNSSPLGVLFNNFKKSSSHEDRLKKISKGRPGSPCYYKHLAFDTEFGEMPLCTASREYQALKINQLKGLQLSTEVLNEKIDAITEKECICQGLGTSAYLKNGIVAPYKLKAVSICPGPNLAYFSAVYSLRQMIDHIYGKINILNNRYRPHMFINELKLYVDYLKKEIKESMLNNRKIKSGYFQNFFNNLYSGIQYYKKLVAEFDTETVELKNQFIAELMSLEEKLPEIIIPQENQKPMSVSQSAATDIRPLL